MKRNHTITLTTAAHDIRPGDVLTFSDGREWDVSNVHSGTITLRRLTWWRSLMRRLWPFRFRGFWRRVWAR